MQYGISPPGYRLPGETHLGAVRLLVSDLERSLEYYQQVIGLRVLSRERTSVALGASGGGSALISLETRPGTKPPPRGGRMACITLRSCFPIARRSDDSSRILASWARMWHRLITRSARRCTCGIPTGWVSRCTPIGRARAWRIRGQEIFMTTERLNCRVCRWLAATSRGRGFRQGHHSVTCTCR